MVGVEEKRLDQLVHDSESMELHLSPVQEELCLSGKVEKKCNPHGSSVMSVQNSKGLVVARLALVGHFTIKEPFSNDSNSSKRFVLKGPAKSQESFLAPLTDSNCICQPHDPGDADIKDCGPESGWCCNIASKRFGVSRKQRKLLSEDVSEWIRQGDMFGSASKRSSDGMTEDQDARRDSFRAVLSAAASGAAGAKVNMVEPSVDRWRAASGSQAAARQTSVLSHDVNGPRTCATVGPCVGLTWDFCTPTPGENRAVFALL